MHADVLLQRDELAQRRRAEHPVHVDQQDRGPASLLQLEVSRCRRSSERTETKNSGTKNIARTTPESMPPMTAVPMAFWLPAPAPEAIINGNVPAMNASD